MKKSKMDILLYQDLKVNLVHLTQLQLLKRRLKNVLLISTNILVKYAMRSLGILES